MTIATLEAVGYYDPEWYATWWRRLTAAGVPGIEIIKRSAPDRMWFEAVVRPLVTKSVCQSAKPSVRQQGSRLRQVLLAV
jgi:hypothetical protein